MTQWFLPQQWQMGFMEPATSEMLAIIDLHNNIMIHLAIVACIVGWLFFFGIYKSLNNSKKKLLRTIIEILKTKGT